jgi:hypothetical protein
MCGAYSTHGGEERETVHLEHLGVDGRIILKWVLKKLNGSRDWVCVVQDRDGWRALVNAVMNFRVP